MDPCRALLLSLLLALPQAQAAPRLAAGARAQLAILETTDLHANLVGYDYYKLAPDPSLGLDRTATLIRQARAEFPNTLLFDDGDTLQGTALGDYEAVARPVPCGRLPAVFAAMRQLDYDGATLGNHDFDYGLDYLAQVTGRHGCAGPGFPFVLANVDDARTHQPLFAPYAIIAKRIRAVDARGRGVTATLKVGIIGFAPPGIAAWDRRWLEGRATTQGVVEAARRWLPKLRARGVDVVVALSHGGLDGAPYTPAMDNASRYLARVPGIDALLLGHAHGVFPDPSAKGPALPDVDRVRGRVAGVPAVMAGLWGKQLGVLRLALRYDGRRWRVLRDATVVETRATRQPGGGYVAPDPAIDAMAQAAHEATIAWVKMPIGSTDFRMATYFADVGDTSALGVVNQAQADYAGRYVAANLPQYAALPVLAMAAPFKSGAAGPGDYTDVAPGSLALNNAADLYLYPNTLSVVKVTGLELKAWLERSAQRFNTIAPARTDEQELVDKTFAGFNFDMPTDPDLRYEIDVTQPPGRRIRNLAWHGAPVADDAAFLVATNSYRAGGGGAFPGLDGSRTVFAAPDTNRDVLIAWLRAHGRLTRAANGALRSWRFTPVRVAGPVVVHSAPGKLDAARAAGLDYVSVLHEDDGKGYAVYAVDLAQ